MGAGILDPLPSHVRHPGDVDEQVVGSELVSGGEIVKGRSHAERADDVRRNDQAELPPDRPGRPEARKVDLAAHDHGDELVVRGEELLLDAARIGRILIPGHATRAFK
jgi:hypothetical protein